MQFSRMFSSSLLALAIVFTGCHDNDTTSSPGENLAQTKAISFHILHMNDIHSHLESEKYSFHMNIDGKRTKVKMQLGGIARAATKIKELQEQYANNVLTINAGDLIQGTMYYTLFEGNATTDLFNEIDWDIFELGNHEFDNGDAHLAYLLDRFNPSVDVLAANVVPDPGNILENRWSPYVIKEIGGEKVGIIGIDIAQKTKVSSRPSDQIQFKDEAETAQRYIDELTKKGINKIVLVTHIGYDHDLDLVKKLKGVDVVIGGDSHTLMGDFSVLGLINDVKEYPKMTTDANGDPVCIAQAWQYSYVVGDIEVSFDRNGKLTACNGHETLLLGKPFEIDHKEANESAESQILSIINTHDNIELVEESPQVLDALQPYKEQLDARKNEVVGYAKTYLGHNRIPYDKKDGKSALAHGSDIAPIVCASFMEEDPNADVCIQNAGGVRTPIEEGNITINTAYTLLPFKNTLYEIKMKGSEIKQVLEDALTNYIDNGGSTGSFPYAYALRYDINASKSKNHRVSNLEVMDKKNHTWSPIENDKFYTVITNSYIAAGRDGYVTFKKVQQEREKGVDTYLDYAMSFVDYVKKHTKEDGGIDKLPLSELPIKCYVDGKHPTCNETTNELIVGVRKPLEHFNFGLMSVTFSNGFKLNATWGLGSAATHKPGDDNTTFYTLTDRGINIKCKDDEEIIGMDICEKGKIFPFPEFTPTIVKFTLNENSAVVKEIIPIKDKDGNPISGISNPLSNFTEKAYDINGTEMNYDPNGLDSEALVALSDGSFWVGEEYGPSLVHIAADGKIIERLVPKGLEGDLAKANYTVKGDLPAIIAKRHENRGIEAIAISSDEKYLYFALQSPLDNPNYKETRNVRLYKMEIANHSNIKEYLYVEDTPDTFQKDNKKKIRKQKDVKISEMVALGNDVLLVLERISATTKLYKIDLNGASTVPEEKSPHLETDASGVTPLTKTLLFTTDSAEGFPSKIEGVANLDGKHFLLINDNDFGIEGDETKVKIVTLDTAQ